MINISDSIKKCWPHLKCEIIVGTIVNGKSKELIAIANQLSTNKLYHSTDIDEIQWTRQGYKHCGKEPSRYRPSAEALRRRIRTGKGLYSISSAVDIINIVSITSGISIGGYDFSAIDGQVTLKSGHKEPYEAIGRGILNIENLPCLYDDLGPFGSPTSDSVRTMISEGTTRLMMVFFDFYNFPSLDNSKNYALKLLEKYCNFRPN